MEELVYLKSLFDSYLKGVYNEDNLAYIPYKDTLNAGSPLYGVPGIIVKFPHLTVTNSRNQAHQITDLYVWITLDLPLATLGRITVSRSTLTMEEYESHYIFSHAGSDMWSFNNLCFGTGEIRDYITGLSNRPVLSNKVSWSLLPQQLHRYFQWESLEGGPYHSIGDIASGTPIENISITYDCLTLCPARKNCRKKCSNLIYHNLKKILHNIPVNYIHGKLTISKYNYAKLFFNIVMLLKDKTEIWQEQERCMYKRETLYTYTNDKLLVKIDHNPSDVYSGLLFYFNQKPVFSSILQNSQIKVIESIDDRILSLMLYIIIKILNKL